MGFVFLLILPFKRQRQERLKFYASIISRTFVWKWMLNAQTIWDPSQIRNSSPIFAIRSSFWWSHWTHTIPGHILTPYFFKIHFNIILPRNLGLFPSVFLLKFCMYFSFPLRTTHPSHRLLFDLISVRYLKGCVLWRVHQFYPAYY